MRRLAAVPLVALLAGACVLDPVDVGGGFTGDDPPGGDPSGGPLPTTGEPPPPVPEDSSSGPPDEPPDTTTDAPPDAPPPGDAPDDGNKLHTALDGCAFNLVWTKGAQYNQGTGLGPGMVAAHDATSLEFQPSDLNAWLFPGVLGTSVLRLELIGVDPDTGDHVLGGRVLSPDAVMILPPLRFDPAAPIVLTDATVQDPASEGPAVVVSLVDATETVLADFSWGLVVDLNGAPNPACAPILEPVFGPL